jgi:oxygen-independent coproporphyrinogen-3 oxidase
MTRMVRNGPMPDFYDRKAIFLEASEKLISGGYKRAGFESYALPTDELISAMENHEAYYNSLGTQKGLANNFIAVGSSAHGSFGDFYFQNFYERDLYVESIGKSEFPIYRGIKLTKEDVLRRKIIKHIRTYFELNFQDIDESTESDFESHFAEELKLLKEFESDGLVEFSGRSFKLTELGQHFSPQVCEVFDDKSNRDVFDISIKPIHFLKK